jgi:hypothetical protein
VGKENVKECLLVNGRMKRRQDGQFDIGRLFWPILVVIAVIAVIAVAWLHLGTGFPLLSRHEGIHIRNASLWRGRLYLAWCGVPHFMYIVW